MAKNVSHNDPYLEIKAIIVRRRSMGKNLAFLHVKVIDGMGDDDFDPSVGNHQEERTIQVVFRRQSETWDSSCDDTFPTKNSQLPYGATISLCLAQQYGDKELSPDHQNDPTGTSIATKARSSPKYEVHKWSILVDPLKEAVEHAKTTSVDEANGNRTKSEGLSCSKYLASRMNQYLKHNVQSKQAKIQPTVNKTADEFKRADLASHGDKKHKALRAKIFASFLIDRFGRKFFQEKDSRVLDIAGGKGQLSLELSLQSQSYCTIIDPLIRGKNDTQTFLMRDIKRVLKAKGIVPTHIAKCFILNDECMELVEQSTLLVGLHPDECTEDIFNAALKLNKPAAIIPCCVFEYLFPHRKLKSGQKVCTYDQFLDYLMEKDERISRFSLPFVGKNQVLVFDPQS